MTEQEMIEWIRNASAKELIARWRFEPPGPWFQGIVGAAFGEKYHAIRDNMDPDEFTRLSKEVGWNRENYSR